MSDDPFADIEDFDDDVGLDEEDKKHAASSNLQEWFKGEKGRTYRIALLYYWPIEASVVIRARKAAKAADKELSKDQAIELVKKALAQRAEKLGKAEDQLTDIDKLDIDHARFKKIKAHYKEGVGYALSRLGLDGPDGDKVWQMMGDLKKYFTTVALIYPCQPNGKVIKDRLAVDWKLLPWRCHSGIYREILDEAASLRDNSLRIAEQDLKCKCTNSDYQNFDINAAGPAIWRRDPKFQAMILDAAHELYEKLIPFRELSTADLRIKLGMTSDNQGEDVSDIDFEGLLANGGDAGPMADV